ncbi:MAG: hypothetical protein LQ344_005458 [Seirophora lacunosa]|nr:MAG: hypothetical protein LQ344_005458 [Seirophora lacunosa]
MKLCATSTSSQLDTIAKCEQPDMEHLHLPKNVVTPGPGPVPYMCTKDYDGGPFLTYPAREGKSSVLDDVSERRRLLPNTPTADLEAFLQTWLFFGLLKEILGDLFVASQFICVDLSSGSSQRQLNTTSLNSIVQDWLNRLQASSDSNHQKEAQYDHIAQCLRLTSVLESNVYVYRPDFNYQIMACLTSVGELLSIATEKAYQISKSVRKNECPTTWAFILDLHPRSVELMKRHGYCPSEIHRIRNTFIFLSTSHFLTWMNRADATASHEHCNSRECLLRLNNLRPYGAQHWLNDCHCPDLTVDIANVIAILSRGGLPLLQMIQTEPSHELRLDVIEASPSSKYVAISHVWSDGLGNPHANALQQCQLQHLLDLARPFFRVGTNALIWLDTLCCPLDPPEARTMALNQMKKPYTDSAFVLVTDSSLYKFRSLGLDAIEKALLIVTSPWMRRLWTLQEGALASKLLFQFRDTAVDIRELRDEVLDICSSDLCRLHLAWDVLLAIKNLRDFFHPFAGGRPDLATAVDALQGRSVTVPSDEPLLIAGLLQLDTSHLLDGPESSRMQRLWSLMPRAPKGIPMSIIFRHESRLTQPGYRWAPQSFLEFQDVVGEVLRTAPALLTPAGLEVRFAAIPIEKPIVPEGLPINFWNRFSEDGIYCRHADGTWWSLFVKGTSLHRNGTTLHTLLGDRSKRYVVILSDPFRLDGSDQFTTGLLVHYEDQQQGVATVRSDLPLGILRVVGVKGVLLEAPWKLSRLLLEDELTGQFTTLAIHDEGQQKRDHAYAALVASFERRLDAMVESIDEGPVLDALKVYNQHANAISSFKRRIKDFYLGRYANLGTMLPSDTRWCVD